VTTNEKLACTHPISTTKSGIGRHIVFSMLVVLLLCGMGATWLRANPDPTPTARPLSLSFTSDETVHEDSGAEYLSPHWLDTDDDGDAMDEGNGERRFPVIFFGGNNVKIAEVSFVVEPMPIFEAILVRGTGPKQHEFVGAAEVVGGAVTATDLTSDKSLDSGEVQFFNPYTIDWQIEFDGTTIVPAGQTDNRMYVPLETPYLDKGTDPVLETVAEFSSQNCLGATSRSAVASMIWAKLSSLYVRRKVRDGHNEFDWTRMTYYNPETPVGQNVQAMVSSDNGSGDCDAWAEFHISALRFQGIDSAQKCKVDPATGKLWIENWEFPDQYADNAIDHLGIRAHDNDDPLSSHFNWHSIAKYDSKYYDPSYGKGSYTSKVKHEDPVVAGWTSNYIPVGGGLVIVPDTRGQLECDYDPTDY